MLDTHTRDSQSLRVHMDQAQLQMQSQVPRKSPPPAMHETLKQWSNLPTISKQLIIQKEKKEILIPTDPYLSYNILSEQPTQLNQVTLKLPKLSDKSEKTIVQSYTENVNRDRNTIRNELQQYVDELVISCYKDIQLNRTAIQTQLSKFEQLYQTHVTDADKKPQTLLQAITDMQKELQQYLVTIQNQCTQHQIDLQSAIKTAVNETITKLNQVNQTKEQITELLSQIMDTINSKLQNINVQTKSLLNATRERIMTIDNDYYQQSQRVMYSRRKQAAEILIKDFKDFVLVQNEWSDPIIQQLNNCNCAHMQMASNINDVVETLEGGNRENAFKLVEVFLESRMTAVSNVELLEKTVLNVKSNIRDAMFSTIHALKAISMQGEATLKGIFKQWEDRWIARLNKIREMSKKLVHANSYYVVGLVVLIGLTEKSKLKISTADQFLQLYFENTVEAIEDRFDRDQKRYSETITKIDQAYEKIWNYQDAVFMSQISQELINAMNEAILKREQLLLRITVEENSDFCKVLKDTVFEELFDFAHNCCINKEQIIWGSMASDNLVDLTSNGIIVKQLLELVNERLHDTKQECTIPIPKKDEPLQLPSTQPSRKDSRKETVKEQPKKDNKKQLTVTYTLNEDGLYTPLPNFKKDMDLNLYYVQKGFYFNNDAVGPEVLKQEIQQLIQTNPDDKAKKQPAPKKGEVIQECFGVKFCEPGTQIIESQNQEQNLKVQLKVAKDFRLILNYAILLFMQHESKRFAYNQAVDDFKDSIEVFKTNYIKILNEVEKQTYDQQMEQYNKDKKEYEKKAKTVKKGTTDNISEPNPPIEPVNIVQLPNDVLEKINSIEIPQYNDRDSKDAHLTLIYQILTFEQLKQVPNFEEQYILKIDDLMCNEVIEEVPQTDSQKNSPQRPPSNKQKTNQKQDKNQPPPTQKIEIQKPHNLQEVFTDSRLVKHGQSEILKAAFKNVVIFEISKNVKKYNEMMIFYSKQGQRVRRTCAADICNFNLLLQQHRMKYAQQAVQQVETKFAQRNAVTQRNIEKFTKKINSLELKYILNDSRFVEFSQYNQQYRPKTQQSTQQEPAKDAKKGDSKKAPVIPPSQQQLENYLIKNKIQNFVSFQTDLQTGQITQISIHDYFAQSHSVFRQFPQLYNEYFLKTLQKGYEQPYLLHRQIIYAQNAYLHQLKSHLQKDLQTVVYNVANNLIKEVNKLKQQGQSWGEEKIDYDFQFADQVIAYLLGQYDEKPRLIIQNTEYIPKNDHPSVQIFESQIMQLQLFKEDLASRLNVDFSAFKKLIAHINNAVQLGNQVQIQQNDKKLIVQRETGRLATLIIGRFSLVSDQLDTINEHISKFENLFGKEQIKENVKKTNSIMITSAVSERKLKQKDQERKQQMKFKLNPNQVEDLLEFVQYSMQLENCYYLIGYDRDLQQLVKKQSQKYTVAQDQYLQRLKAFNFYYSLLLSFVYTLNQLSFKDQNKQQQFIQLQELLTKMQPSTKAYQAKNKIYINQSQIDILSQLKEELTLINQKFSSSTQINENAKLEQDCVTENDWFNYYMNQMCTRLSVSHIELKTKILNLIIHRDNICTQILTNLNKYFVEYFDNVLNDIFVAKMQQIDQYQKTYISSFNSLYDSVRPVLSQLSDKCNSLIQTSTQIYNRQSKVFMQEFYDQQVQFVQLLKFFSSCQLVPGILYSLLPSVTNSCSVSLQLNMIFEQLCKQLSSETPDKQIKKDTKKDKNQQEESQLKMEPQNIFDTEQRFNFDQKLLSDEYIGQIQQLNSQEDSFFGNFAKALKLFTSASQQQIILFNNTEFDQKILTQAPAVQKGGSQFMQVQISPKPLEPVTDVESLNLQRICIEDRPLTKTGDRKAVQPKGKEVINDEIMMPTTPCYQLKQINIQSFDEKTFEQFAQLFDNKYDQIEIQAITSADKLSVSFLMATANEVFSIFNKISQQIYQYYEKGCKIHKIMVDVKQQFEQVILDIKIKK